MIERLQKDLFDKWSNYGPQQQKEMIDEYISISDKKDCCKEKFLNFLKDKLEPEGHRKENGDN